MFDHSGTPSSTRNWTKFKDESAKWDARSEGGQAALSAIANIKDDVKKLLNGAAGKSGTMKAYLEFIRQAADNDFKARSAQLDLFLKAGKPRDLDVQTLRTVWSDAKQAAEVQFKAALGNQNAIPARTKFSQVLSFKDSLGSALKNVASAANKNNAAKTRSAVDKAVRIVNGYFQTVNAAEKDWWSRNNQQKADPDFFDLLKKAIRDIVLALKNARP